MNLEAYFLATLLYWPEEIAEVAPLIQPEDFTEARNEVVYSALRGLAAKGQYVETHSLLAFLRALGALERAGGEFYIVRDIGDLVPASGATAKDHAKLIRDAAIRRRMRRDALALLEAAEKPEVPIEDLAGLAERAAVDATARRVERGAILAKHVLPEVFKTIEAHAKGEITGIRTGFTDLDQHLGGLQRTDLIILGGRPGMGKTSLALDFAGNIAIDGKGKVAFFELEMSRTQIIKRLLCSRAKVSGQLLKTGKLPQRDYPRLSLAVGPIGEAPFYIDDTVGLTPLQLLSKARQIKAKAGGLDLVVVDNIQIMRGDGKFGSRREELANVSNNLKRVAKELEVPLIAISHLSRECERRGDPEPNLSDLKETGDIEQDADIVMLLYREEVYKEVPLERHGETKVILAKNRDGESIAKIIRFIPELSSFTNWSSRQDAPPESYKEKQVADSFLRGTHGY
jgi:replicative DNA helicase